MLRLASAPPILAVRSALGPFIYAGACKANLERVCPVSASDWIAVVGACVAALAFIVSSRALQLQRAGAKASTRTEFDELVRQLWVTLSKSYEDLGRPQPGSGVPPPDVAAALGEIQTLALRAHDFLYPASAGDMSAVGWYRRLLQLWNPPSEPPHPNWYDAVVLASSFAQVWDYERAKRYWELAVNLSTGPGAEVGPMAQVNTLREIGIFYYVGNSDSELQLARDAFNQAFNVLRPEVNGVDFAYFQNSVTRFIQAQQEDAIGDIERAAQCVREAWHSSTHVRAKWRRQQVQNDIAAFLSYGVSYERDPRRVQRYDDLPQELMDEVANLQGQQQSPDAQNQMFAAAWQQGFNAAHDQMSTAQQSSAPLLPPDSPASPCQG